MVLFSLTSRIVFLLCCFLKVFRSSIALKAREWKTKTASNRPANVCLRCKIGKKQNIFKEGNQLVMSDKNSIIQQCKFVQQIANGHVRPRNLFPSFKSFQFSKRKNNHKDLKNIFSGLCLPNIVLRITYKLQALFII